MAFGEENLILAKRCFLLRRTNNLATGQRFWTLGFTGEDANNVVDCLRREAGVRRRGLCPQDGGFIGAL